MIRKRGNKWVLYSKNGKKLYESTRIKDVFKRERQIKHYKKLTKKRKKK